MTAPTDPLTRARALREQEEAEARRYTASPTATGAMSLTTVRALLAIIDEQRDELEKARDVVEAARAHDWYARPNPEAPVLAALARYDAARRGEAG